MKKFLFSLFLLLGISAGLSAAESSDYVVKVVFIGNRSNEEFTVDNLDMTIEDLKKMIEKSTEIPAGRQRLLFAGHERKDNERVRALFESQSSYIPPRKEITIHLFEKKIIPPVLEAIAEASDDSETSEKSDYSRDSRKESEGEEKLTLESAPHFSPRKSILSPQQKAAIGITLAALTTAAIGYVGKRLYQNKKKRLVRKYKLGNLTKLQDKVWLATVLASYGVPQPLRRLVRNNSGTLVSFTGKDPRALAELYYGHAPSQEELSAFIAKFFANIE